jgi:hypothetical protein
MRIVARMIIPCVGFGLREEHYSLIPPKYLAIVVLAEAQHSTAALVFLQDQYSARMNHTSTSSISGV